MRKQKTSSFIVLLSLIVFLFLNCDPLKGSISNISNKESSSPVTAPVKYTFDIGLTTEGSGTGRITTTSTISGSYLPGSSIVVEALADADNSFFGWYDAAENGNFVSKSIKYEFTLKGNTKLYARFIHKNYVIIIEDPNLAKTVRKAISPEPVGELTFGVVSKIISLRHTSSSSADYISTLNGLEYLTSLTEVHIDNSYIKDLTPVQSLTKLSILNITNNLITDLTPLKNLESLTRLNVSGNGISDLTPLQNLPWLFQVRVAGNSITDLTPLSILSSLVTLDANANQIVNLKPLEKLPRLTNLFLSHNKIVDLTPLKNIQTLKYIELQYNQISNVAPLKDLKMINQLFIHNNKIKNVTPLITGTIFSSGWSHIKILEGNTIPQDQIAKLRTKVYVH